MSARAQVSVGPCAAGSSSADTAGTSGSSLNPATPAFRSDCPWKRNAECCPIFDEPLAVVTFHGDQTSRHVIRETSVPPLGSSTTREPTPAIVAVGRYGDVTTTAPASHLCSAAHPVWGHGVREIPDFCCELELRMCACLQVPYDKIRKGRSEEHTSELQ